MDKMKNAGKWFLARFEEASTWSGVGVGSVLMHIMFPGILGDRATAVCAALSAFLAVVIPEKGSDHE